MKKIILLSATLFSLSSTSFAGIGDDLIGDDYNKATCANALEIYEVLSDRFVHGEKFNTELLKKLRAYQEILKLCKEKGFLDDELKFN